MESSNFEKYRTGPPLNDMTQKIEHLVKSTKVNNKNEKLFPTFMSEIENERSTIMTYEANFHKKIDVSRNLTTSMMKSIDTQPVRVTVRQRYIEDDLIPSV